MISNIDSFESLYFNNYKNIFFFIIIYMTTQSLCDIDYYNPVSLLYLFPQTETSKYFFENFPNLSIDSKIEDLLYEPINQIGKGGKKPIIEPLKCNLSQKIKTYIMISTVLFIVYKYLTLVDYTTISASIIQFLKENCVPDFIITIIDYINKGIISLLKHYSIPEESWPNVFSIIYSLIISSIRYIIKMLCDEIKHGLGYDVKDEKTIEKERLEKTIHILNKIKEFITNSEMRTHFYNHFMDFINRVNKFIDYICVSIFYKKKQDGGMRKSSTHRKKYRSRRYINKII